VHVYRIWWICVYMVANPNFYFCSLKNLSLFWNLRTLQENMGYLYYYFLFIFSLGHLSIFSILFLLHSHMNLFEYKILERITIRSLEHLFWGLSYRFIFGCSLLV
jgi:hypothetical protein